MWYYSEVVILSEVRQRKTNLIWYPLYVASKKKSYKWTSLQNKNRPTNMKQTYGYWRGNQGVEGINQKLDMNIYPIIYNIDNQQGPIV